MWLECEAFCRKRQSRKHQHLILSDSTSWGCAATKGRSSMWSVAGRARQLCGLCLASNASVRYRWFPSVRNSADEPPRRFEWTSQYHARFRETSNSRLPRQCVFWLSWTHRVLTASNESTRKRISVPSLDQQPLKQLKSSNELPTEQSKHLRCHCT